MAFNLKLTAHQAKFLWDTLDGAMDAGACSDGMTADEQTMGQAIIDKMLPMILAINAERKNGEPS